MNEKYRIGRRISSLERYADVGPITAVALLLDDNNEIVAGDTTGYTLEIDCPYGTEAMANNLLASLSGKTYKGFRASGAILNPAAELGDGITVDGEYSFLAYRNVTCGPGHMSEVAAPGDSYSEHEYGYKTPSQRQTNRKIAQTNSAISKTAEEIRMEVFGEGGLQATIQLELDKITSEIFGENGESRIDQTAEEIRQEVSDTLGNYSTKEQTADSISTAVSGLINGDDAQTLIDQSIDKIELSVSSSSGSTTFKLTSDGATLNTETLELSVKAAKISGTLTADQIILTGSIAWSDLSESVQEEIYAQAADLPDYITSTKITETTIESPTIMGGTLTGGEIYGGAFYDLSEVGMLTLSCSDRAWLTYTGVTSGREMFSIGGTDYGDKYDATMMTFADTTILLHYASTGEISLHNVDITLPLSDALEDDTVIAKLKEVLGLS